jgi:hypothetical protein
VGLRSSKLLVTLYLAVSCVPTRTQQFRPGDSEDGGVPPIEVEGGVDDADTPIVKPHAILAISPPHGPFSGGTLASIRGNGFGSDARVWFGDVRVPKESTIVVDPQRIQLTTPAGAPGSTDVIVQNGDDESTRVTLPGGFTYDDLYVDPVTGPTAGGTVVSVHAYEPLFDDDTRIEIDLEPCEIEDIVSERLLTCRTPPGTPGTKNLRATVTSEDEDEPRVLDVLDGFTYVVSDDGFRGGLGGDPLGDELNVLVLSDTADPLAISDATVIVGDDVESALTEKTDSFGTAVIAGDSLGPAVTVTVVKKCFQPFTYVGVPVERVTVYLAPVLSPACVSDGLPPSGRPGRGAGVSGEIFWPLDEELREAGWENVPLPQGEMSQKVGYIFRLASRATDQFSQPSAVGAITPNTNGEVGYSFYFSTSPGNFALYALVGTEDRSKSPYVFTPYAMGLTRGVAVEPSETRDEVFIQIDTPLDHALAIDATGPTLTARGPDHIEATVAIEVGNEGYILLPNGRQTSLLPATQPFRFVGVPPLSGSLTGARYIATATAMTGTAGGAPLSAVGLFASVTGLDPIGVGAFLELPRIDAPASSSIWSRTELELDREPGGPAPDLTVVDLATGAGLVSWRIVAAGAPERVRVPDISALGFGLVEGPLTVQVTLAAIDDFSYGNLKSRDLTTRGWRSYSRDVSFASY